LRVIAGKGVIPYLNMAFILEVIQHNFNFLETFSFKKKGLFSARIICCSIQFICITCKCEITGALWQRKEPEGNPDS
jgi:hypothetical protein